MKRIVLALLVTSSFALAATRPQYGGTLRITVRSAPVSIDPVQLNQNGGALSSNLTALIFDTLVNMTDHGTLEPGLASSWQAEPGNQRWHLFLRRGATFSDTTPLTPDVAAASLRASNPSWKVFPAGDSVVIETDSPAADLPSQLTLSRYAIAKRVVNKAVGTGPYVVSQFDPGKKLTLAARDDYWNGRPFVDSVEIDLGRNLRDQMISLDVGKADLVEIAPEQIRRAGMENRRIEASSPSELVALIFTHDPASPDENRLRQALSAGIDRNALSSVFLQGGAEPAGSLLPNWMTGYAFLFPVSSDAGRARQVRGDARQAGPWVLGYDTNDSLARVMAERIALNGRDVGITIQPLASGNADLRLVRIPISSLDQRIALASILSLSGSPQPKTKGDSVEDMYSAESALVSTERVIPLLHARTAVALSPSVTNWDANRIGFWQLPNVWLGAGKP